MCLLLLIEQTYILVVQRCGHVTFLQKHKGHFGHAKSVQFQKYCIRVDKVKLISSSNDLPL